MTYTLVRTTACDWPRVMSEDIYIVVWEVPVLKSHTKAASWEAPKARAPSPAQPCYERVSVSERAWVWAVESGGNEV